MKKVSFPKTTKIVDVSEDLGIEGYNGVKFEMWRDPSRKVLLTIIGSFAINEDSLTETDANDFFSAISELIIDSNIEGISFDTQEETEKAFNADNLPWGFVYSVIVSYVVKIIDESESLKKVFGLSTDQKDSGDSKKNQEQE